MTQLAKRGNYGCFPIQLWNDIMTLIIFERERFHDHLLLLFLKMSHLFKLFRGLVILSEKQGVHT